MWRDIPTADLRVTRGEVDTSAADEQRRIQKHEQRDRRLARLEKGLLFTGAALQLIFVIGTVLAMVFALVVTIWLFGPLIGVLGFGLFLVEFRYPVWRYVRWRGWWW